VWNLKFGVHVSISGSIDMAVDRAVERNCTTFQIFTRNPRGWKFKQLSNDEAKTFVDKLTASGIDPAVAHMPYLPNLASPKKNIYAMSLKTLIAELDRCGRLEIPYLVTHLGSHLGRGMEVGFERIINACNVSLSKVKNNVMLLLENTAGTKNSMGSSFEDVQQIIDRISERERVGVCFDTCHGFAAGYDLRNTEAVQKTLGAFDKILGLRLLKAIHINDSKGKLGSHIDRHEHIGMGFIGNEGFRAILHHQSLKDLPFILETPIDNRRDDVGNLRKVRELAQDAVKAISRP
jgi:deoxyribonuclease-4